MKCTAKSSRTGKPCQKSAIEGGRVCSTHGGSAPQVRAAAQARLLALVSPALSAIARNLKKDVPEAVQIAAAREVLNRADLSLGVEDKSLAAVGTLALEIINARKARMGE